MITIDLVRRLSFQLLLTIILLHHKEQTINEYGYMFAVNKNRRQRKGTNYLLKDMLKIFVLSPFLFILYFKAIAILLADYSLSLNDGLSLSWLFHSGFPLLQSTNSGYQPQQSNHASDSSKFNIHKTLNLPQ